MFSTWRRQVCALLPAAACALVVLLASAAIRADEVELPTEPCIGDSVTMPVGEITVEATDTGGATIYAKDTLEPQMTVMMLTTDVSVSPDQTLGVQTYPTVEVWTQ
jgi:hypothetical protein